MLQEVPETRFLLLQLLEEPKPEQVDPAGGCGPTGSPCWSRDLAGGREARGDELTAAPISIPMSCVREGGTEIGSKVKPRKDGEVDRRCFQEEVLLLIIIV